MEATLASRPTRRDKAVIQRAAVLLLKRLRDNVSEPFDPEDSEDVVIRQIEKALTYAHGDDGYEIAKRLEDEGWDVTTSLVEEVDGGCLWEAYDECVAKWVAEQSRTPQLVIGTTVVVHPNSFEKLQTAHGEITAISQERGTYTVLVPSWGHVRSGTGTHGRILPWEQVEGWQTAAA
jgi:hypothetical protein